MKEFLSQKGIAFKDRDVSREPLAAQELMSRTGRMAVPVIIVDGQTIIGFDRARLEQVLSVAQSGERPSFGAAIADASRVASRPSPTASGAYVGRVRPGSAAEKAGLAPGDIITEFNRQRINGASDLESALSRLQKGSRFSLVVLRGTRTFATEGML